MGAEDTRAAEADTRHRGSRSATDDPLSSITAVRCSPERTVFTEDDNDDGWISTDTTVAVER